MTNNIMTNEQWIDAKINDLMNDYKDDHGYVLFDREDLECILLSAINQGEQRFAERLREGLPEKQNGIHPETGMPQYLPFNKGWTVGFNDCLSEVSTLISDLIEGK
jgi:hypothetical protein